MVRRSRSVNGDFSGPMEQYVEVDSRLLRTNEIHDMKADARLARVELRWSPRVRFKELVRMMVESDLREEKPVPELVSL